MNSKTKSVLKLDLHKTLPGQQVVEVWHEGELIATVTGLDGAGVRVISKHAMIADFFPGRVGVMHVQVLTTIPA